MKERNFLIKLKNAKKLKLIEPSTEIYTSYSIKSNNCLKSAKILFDSPLYENSVSSAYYAMYNASLSLFFYCGIKCENHTASIILLEKVFNLSNLKGNLESVKKERIDKQYYVSEEENVEMTKDIAENMFFDAENFILDIRAYIEQLSNSDVEMIRLTFEEL
ncbi:MAG: HEPN domain-containing protein [DPANN group archaeon]|nr:HEPN domain-containing protein [DPANN group archaeon]